MRYAAQRTALLVLFAVLLFGATGRVTCPRGWGYVIAVLLLEVVTLVLLAILQPGDAAPAEQTAPARIWRVDLHAWRAPQRVHRARP